MNILTIGLEQSTIDMFDMLAPNNTNRIKHLYDKNQALLSIRDSRNYWNWIILQGHDNPEHWKSILCAINASTTNTSITVLSSHIDGSKLRTPVCSMHSDENDNLAISRCAMQSLLQQDRSTNPVEQIRAESPTATPIVFEYHAPCR